MFHVGVCDDDAEVLSKVKQYFKLLSLSTNYSFDVHCFSSGEQLLQHYKAMQGEYTYHLLILDVEMSGISGIETAQAIRSLPDRDVQIIFLSSYPEYIMDSFDVQTFQYLLKPVPYELFQDKILKLCSYIHSSPNRFFTIKVEDDQVVLRRPDIIAIVKIKHSLAQNKLKLITASREYLINGTLQSYSDKLGNPFLLIHRSIIVNLEHVRRFNANSVVMSSDEEYPIGRSQSKAFKDVYAGYVLEEIQGRG
ncbi:MULTISPECIES: LytR/AlgR family response regulator transcription factor [unclassified Paenibacillus]|uniref:LytR/AlgR family response regulator transcription factor n=1 Tax=unclassified Paenibacillus TaxID=185978 RepID=UPI0030F9EBE2